MLPKLGSGGRFAALSAKLSHEPGVTNPAALAASIGRKKYGAKKMAKLSAGGRRHALLSQMKGSDEGSRESTQRDPETGAGEY
jgi:hypothetical protein